MATPLLETSQLISVRNRVLQGLKASADSFVVTNIQYAASHIPFAKLEDPQTQAGLCWVIASILDDKDRKTRVGVQGGPLVMREFGIQVAYQQANVLPTDVDTLDALCLLVEQFRDAVKNYDYSISPDFVPFWTRNETLRDENGVPYHYYMLREGNIFESYFTAYFIIPHQ